MARTKAVVSSVVDLEFPMHIIAKNALYRRKTGMVAQRLLIWEAQKLTCSMKEKNMGSKEDKNWNSYIVYISIFLP